ncbi:MAG: tetratricopeptide repeat protein [Saprospiraceae bacterium]|nr:tetratricopeptide repeat protein [Saprospiraceae bacterium]
MTTRFFSFATLILFQLTFAVGLFAQDPNLANQYFTDGEYEKAAALYEQLSENDPRSEYYFNRYVDCLLNLERYDESEKAVKKQLKRMPDNANIYVVYGNIYDRQGKTEEAKAQYTKAVNAVAPDYAAVNRLATTFVNTAKYDFAIQTYERGATLLKDPNRFAFNLGDLYRRKGDMPKMIEYYLNAITVDPGRLGYVQTLLAKNLSPDDYTELQTQLYARLQEKENPDYIELLAWSFVQRKDFKSALRQYKALDKRLGEVGQRVYKLAGDASAARDYETAIAAYDYIITEKGPTNPYFFDAKREAMNCRREKITEGYTYTQEDLKLLETDYEQFLAQYGGGRNTAQITLQLAELEALYMGNLNKAISLLDHLRQEPGLDPNTLARVKINLADYYLMTGERWESTLLYSQVDKDLKEAQIGQEARFKNARLAYFMGDFQWAQAQFDVLKASTSKLISNDALDLSVFIMDNLNLDTTADAINLYAGAELMVFQNRFEDAFARLDTLRRQFPEHSLQDDVLYLEAQIYEKKRDYPRALDLYRQVVEKDTAGIRADNSLYAMAQLYETRLNEPEKAKDLYEKIFIDYSGSVFAVEARKRYRILRGDKVQ